MTVSVTFGLQRHRLCAVAGQATYLRAVTEVDRRPASDARAAPTDSASAAAPPTSVGRQAVSASDWAPCGTARRAGVRSTRCAGRRRLAAYAEPSTSIGSASPIGPRRAGLSIRSARLGPCRGAHPHRRRHRHGFRHRQRAAEVHRLLRRQRHGRRAPHAVGSVGATGPAEQLRPQIPLCDSGTRRRSGHDDGMAQVRSAGRNRTRRTG